jgi:hypothetical protein
MPFVLERITVLMHPRSQELPTLLPELLQSSPILGPLNITPRLIQVPEYAATTREQLQEWGSLWPVAFSPIRQGARAEMRTELWPRGKVDWVRRQMRKVWGLARKASSRGQVRSGMEFEQRRSPY